MKTIPSFSAQIWNTAKASGGLHPGLTFYRFCEVLGKKEGKYDAVLGLMTGKTAIPFAGKLAERVRDQAQALEATGIWKTKVFKNALETRMAVGMGISSQTENGICLDHTHGIPVIPGSALKGVAQDYALMEQIPKDDHTFVAVFGSQSSGSGAPDPNFVPVAGHVAFFDAMPVSSANPFDTDIMNPHYGDYYSSEGGTPPADYISPNPIFFLTVKPGTVFQFALAARDACFSLNREENGKTQTNEKLSAEILLDKAVSFLKGALCNLGVGAKTSVGYGIFNRE